MKLPGAMARCLRLLFTEFILTLGYGGFEEQMLAAYTDEAMFTHAGRSIEVFTQGTESPSNISVD